MSLASKPSKVPSSDKVDFRLNKVTSSVVRREINELGEPIRGDTFLVFNKDLFELTNDEVSGKARLVFDSGVLELTDDEVSGEARLTRAV